MTKKLYKTFKSHEQAKHLLCFNCYKSLEGTTHEESGYPDGKWRVKCLNCGMYSFYDVEEESNGRE